MGELEAFVSLHAEQLQAIPQPLWPLLFEKCENRSFDAGSHFIFCQDDDLPPGSKLSLLAAHHMASNSDIFLVDHFWSFPDLSTARVQLEQSPALRERVCALLDFDGEEGITETESVERMLRSLWLLTGSYEHGGQTVFFVMDEVGSRLSPGGEEAGFGCALFLHVQQGVTYHVFWPQREVEEHEEVLCQNLLNGRRKLAAVDNVFEPFEVNYEPDDKHADEKLMEGVREVGRYLVSQGYTVKGIGDLLGLPPCVGFSGQNLSGTARLAVDAQLTAFEGEGDGRSILHDLVRLLVLNLPLTNARAQRALGQHIVVLERAGVLFYPAGKEGGESALVTSLVQFVPLLDDVILATDYFQTGGEVLGFDPVMYIGVDSLGLVGAAPRAPAGRILDLCCGSGVQGIAALRLYANHVTCVDINPRAGKFTTFNFLLNGFEPAQFRVCVGSLYEALYETKEDGEETEEGESSSPKNETRGDREPEIFEVILANPPYIPNAGGERNLELFGDGGSSGEDVLVDIIEGAPRHLAPKGRIGIVGNMVNTDEYPVKVCKWWGRGEKAGKIRSAEFHVWHGKLWEAEEYASLVYSEKPLSDPAVSRYANALRECGVKHVTNGLMFGWADCDGVKGCWVGVTAGPDDLWQAVTVIGGGEEGLVEKMACMKM